MPDWGPETWLHMQDGQAGAKRSVGAAQEASHRVPPATPQQLRSAVLELTGQLESARQSLQTCEGSPCAHPAQPDDPGPAAANPAQVLLGRPNTQQHSAAETQTAAPGQAAGGGTSVVTPSSLAGSPGGDTEIEAGAVTRQQTLISTDDEGISVADADVSSSLPTAPAEAPARRGSRLAPAMRGATMAGQAMSGRAPSAEAAAAPPAQEVAAPTVSAPRPATPVLAAGAIMQQPEGETSPELSTEPGDVNNAALGSQTDCAPADAVDADKRLKEPTKAGHNLAATARAQFCNPSSNDEQALTTAAAAAAARKSNGLGTADRREGSPAALYVQRDKALAPDEAWDRSESPDFGGPQQGQWGLASVLCTVGKLCNDIDPTYRPSASRFQPAQPARAADKQAHAWDDAADGASLLQSLKHAAAPGVEGRPMEDSAHTGSAGASAGTAAARASKAQALAVAGSSASLQNVPAGGQSAGSAGSWEVGMRQPAERGEQHSETTLTDPRAMGQVAEQPGAEDQAVGPVSHSGLPRPGTVGPATPGAVVRRPRGRPPKRARSAVTLVRGKAHAQLAKHAAAAGNPSSSSALPTAAAVTARRAAGAGSSGGCSIQVPAAVPERGVATDQGKGATASCMEIDGLHSSLRTRVKTSANSPLTEECIYG